MIASVSSTTQSPAMSTSAKTRVPAAQSKPASGGQDSVHLSGAAKAKTAKAKSGCSGR